MLFVNYPQSIGQKSFESLVVSAGNASAALNETLSPDNSNTLGDKSDADDCGVGRSSDQLSDAEISTDGFLGNLSSTSALQVSVNMTLNLSCRLSVQSLAKYCLH